MPATSAPRAATFPITLLVALLVATGSDAAAQQTAAPAPEASAADPALLDAERMPRAVNALLLDAVATKTGAIAVGERGQILSSTDGATWTQAAAVPTRSTLTAVAAAGNGLWAAGHDGVILHSTDGGGTWRRQRAAPWSADDPDPTHGVPVLDLLFTDARHGFAVGAYSLLLVTEDGGATWTARALDAGGEAEPPQTAASATAPAAGEDDDWNFSADELELEDEADPHLNAIARTGAGHLMIAGERGTMFRSRDGGATWERRKLPYEGSMFGVLAWEDEHVLVFGLRGNVFESRDLGETWTKIDSGTSASLMGGLALPDGGAVLVGGEGAVLSRARGRAVHRARAQHRRRRDAGPGRRAAARRARLRPVRRSRRGSLRAEAVKSLLVIPATARDWIAREHQRRPEGRRAWIARRKAGIHLDFESLVFMGRARVNGSRPPPG